MSKWNGIKAKQRAYCRNKFLSVKLPGDAMLSRSRASVRLKQNYSACGPQFIEHSKTLTEVKGCLKLLLPESWEIKAYGRCRGSSPHTLQTLVTT
jgi:hypothetical protein